MFWNPCRYYFVKVDWRSTRGQVEVRVPIKRETSKVVDQNVMASSQSTTSEKPPETKEDESSSEESDNDSDESVSSYCEWDRKPLESYYCKCSRERSGYTYPMVRRTNMADANERDLRFVFLLAFISIYSEQNLKIMLLIIWCHVRICVAAYYIFVHDVTTEINDI